MATDVLTEYGWGGGYYDGKPLSDTSEAFKWNFAKAAFDVGGAGAILRANYKFNADGSSPNTADIDKLVAAAARWNCQVLLSVNVAQPTSPSKVPVINDSGVMQGYKNAFTTGLNRYSGPDRVFAKVGDTLTVAGNTFTVPATWTGVKWYECWNEPQSIGDCGGALNIGGSAQGRPWYDLVYILNRDFCDAADAHPARSSFQIAAFDIGGLEWDYLFGGGRISAAETSANHTPVLWARSKGFNWNRFDAFAMHCYVVNDPLTNNPTNGPRGNLNTLATHMRPKMNANGADQCEIWITEGGHGGSLQLSTNTEYKNRYHPRASYSNHFKDISWGHAWTDSGKDPAQLASDETHPQIMANYMTKLRNMNVNNGTKVRMVTPHMFVRQTTLDLVQANDVDAWHQGRCMIDTFPTDPKTDAAAYTAATGSGVSKSSPDWLPVAKAWYLERIGGGPGLSPPSLQSGSQVTVSDSTPSVGQAITADKGQWDGNPSPTFTYQWIRDASTNISGATARAYTPAAADLGHTLKVKVTATNSQGTANSTSAATAAVNNSGIGVPVNVTPPTLTTNGAAVSAGNPPRVGQEVQTTPGTYTPTADTYTYGWEALAPDGVTVTVI